MGDEIFKHFPECIAPFGEQGDVVIVANARADFGAFAEVRLVFIGSFDSATEDLTESGIVNIAPRFPELGAYSSRG